VCVCVFSVQTPKPPCSLSAMPPGQGWLTSWSPMAGEGLGAKRPSTARQTGRTSAFAREPDPAGRRTPKAKSAGAAVPPNGIRCPANPHPQSRRAQKTRPRRRPFILQGADEDDHVHRSRKGPSSLPPSSGNDHAAEQRSRRTRPPLPSVRRRRRSPSSLPPSRRSRTP
jgi:hypothetical protein